MFAPMSSSLTSLCIEARDEAEGGKMGRQRSWNDAQLIEAVRTSKSFREVIRKLDLAEAGGGYLVCKARIIELNLDTSHFLGQRANCGPAHRGGFPKKSHEQLLIIGIPGSPPVNTHRLRRAMIEYGFAQICSICTGLPVWNGRDLTLQIDHRNGQRWDNRPENVRFVCPNCHSQTETFGSRNRLARSGEVRTSGVVRVRS
jgi:hypothetical protein